MDVYDKLPQEAWARLDARPPLFAAADWLDHLAHRIEGEHRWFVDEGGIGFFGSLIDDPQVTRSKNVWDLLYDPYDFMRTLTSESVQRQSELRETAPPRDEWFPVLLITYPGFECFGIGPGAQDKRLLDDAVGGIVRSAREMGARTVLFHYVQPEETLLARTLRGRGFARVPSALRANLRLPGTGFDDYLAALSYRRRREVRRNRQALAEQGVRVARLSLAECTDTQLDVLVALRESHRAKHGKRPDPAAERRQLEELRDSFGDRGTVFTAAVDGRVIGFSLLLDAGGVYHGWTTGTDYADERSKGTYFELGYYAPIEYVYERGGGELSFGYGTEDAKLSRGCRVDAVHSYLLVLDPVRHARAQEVAAALELVKQFTVHADADRDVTVSDVTVSVASAPETAAPIGTDSVATEPTEPGPVVTSPAATAPIEAAPTTPIPIATVADAWRIAKQVLPEPAYDYCAGAAGDESGMRRNVAAFERRLLVPRVLSGVERPDLRTDVPGGSLRAPLLVAPMGLQALCHPEAESGTAAAAAALGLGFVLSTFASHPVEQVARTAGAGVRWQQVYLLREPAVTRSLIERAEAAGCTALVVTLDVPVVGLRPRDLRHAFDRFSVAPPGVIDDPVFRALLTERYPDGGARAARALLDELFPFPESGWPDLERLIAQSRLPVLVKGILSTQDAVRAVDCGAAGIVVSTHGGRQSERYPAALDALGPVLDAVAGRVPVLIDSGVRSGGHAATALALGAHAVLVGRPALWGLAAGGTAGVRRVLELLLGELTTAMVLSGAADPAALRNVTVIDSGGVHDR